MGSTAIKDVTEAIQTLLLSQLGNVMSTAQVSLVPPGDAMPSGIGVNLYLYRIMESPFTRNQRWPGDRQTAPAATPALGLELSYLLTPFAPAPDPTSAMGDDAHTMLGAAMWTLHENPVLNNVHILGFDADTALAPELLNSFEQIKIRLATTSLEELSKIWATINQPYRLSVAYDVSLVELTPTAAPPISGAVTLQTGLKVVAWQPPRLDTLSPPTGALANVDASGALAANTVTIAGAGLMLPVASSPPRFLGEATEVQIGGTPAQVSSFPPPTDRVLTVVLPLDVDAGPEEDIAVTLKGMTGTPLSYLVTPWLARITPIRSDLGPAVSPPSPALLALQGQGFTSAPQGVRFAATGELPSSPPPAGPAIVAEFVGAPSDSQATVAIPANLANGIYDVRIVVASATASANGVSNGRTLEIIPLVSAPIGVAVVVNAQGAQVHQLTINGARLNGGDLRVSVDGAIYQAGANTNPSQLQYTLGRELVSGPHTVSVTVDGSTSHDVTLEV